MLESDALQFAGHEVGGLLDVVLVFVHGADTGNAQQFFQFLKETFLILASITDGGCSHEILTFANAMSAVEANREV